MKERRPKKPKAVLFYDYTRDPTEEEEPEEWHLYPPIWVEGEDDDEGYWDHDMDENSLTVDGKDVWHSEEEAKKALLKLQSNGRVVSFRRTVVV